MSIPPPPGPQQPQGPYQQGQFPPGAQPYPPYQPWAQGYTPYNRPAPVNGLAVASLVLGILCCVPGLGLLLGLIALGQIRKNGERGRSMAVYGSVLSTLGLVLWVLVLATGAASDFWDGVKDSARDNGSAYTLAKGECFDSPSGSLEGEAYDVDKVPCAGEHDGEVFASFKMSGYDSYPGDRKVTDLADTRCWSLRYDYAMDAWAVPDDVDVYYLTPTRDSWGLGDREITCVFGNTDEKASLTGSVRNDARTLDADQLAYLNAVNIANRALDSQPVDSPDDDLKANTRWAARLSDAFTRQAAQLRAHDWPSGAQAPVTAVARQVESIQEEWAKAAKATDADAFYASYDRAMTLSTTGRSVTARKALGLATTPPPDGETGGGGGGGGDSSDIQV
ncbi:DUF4190 domain-containing protein [Streptomyces cylindrosporus]|uniref:DUF4190 domain-containing protein n=1 Tax=Streptomyces cylindrosporus TaxID=2927583 RepID=A0ABS9Y6L1_9ACTN|nr:DUF4190 domain-containing protein [Streptomyces cylindrosporus]MCI3272856.1 DUF4190 domain-containing protein [Streptomyces cylindrosporus]